MADTTTTPATPAIPAKPAPAAESKGLWHYLTTPLWGPNSDASKAEAAAKAAADAAPLQKNETAEVKRGWFNKAMTWSMQNSGLPIIIKAGKEFLPEGNSVQQSAVAADKWITEKTQGVADWVTNGTRPSYHPEMRKIDGKDQIVAVVTGLNKEGKEAELKTIPTGFTTLEEFKKYRIAFENKNEIQLDPKCDLGLSIAKEEADIKAKTDAANAEKKAEQERKELELNPIHPIDKLMSGDILGAIKDVARTHWGKVLIGGAIIFLGDKAGDILGKIGIIPDVATKAVGVGLNIGAKGLGWTAGLAMIGMNIVPAFGEVKDAFGMGKHKAPEVNKTKAPGAPEKTVEKTVAPEVEKTPVITGPEAAKDTTTDKQPGKKDTSSTQQTGPARTTAYLNSPSATPSANSPALETPATEQETTEAAKAVALVDYVSSKAAANARPSAGPLTKISGVSAVGVGRGSSREGSMSVS